MSTLQSTHGKLTGLHVEQGADVLDVGLLKHEAVLIVESLADQLLELLEI
jgi:hypothetical protein